VDVVKTRLMTQPSLPDGRGALYSGVINCGARIFHNEGPSAFYKGFIPNWMRKAPWCVLFFLSYEQARMMMQRPGVVIV